MEHYLENELEKSVIAFFATTANDGKNYNVEYYNLDMVISIGYRVKSKRGILFRKWALEIINNIKAKKAYAAPLIVFEHNGLSLDVNVSPSEDTVWLTKEQIAILFDRNRTIISKHISNIYREGELDRRGTCAKNAHMGHLDTQKYNVELYNLDIIISVGYRIKSNRVVLFRK